MEQKEIEFVRLEFERWYSDGDLNCPSIERANQGYRLMQAQQAWIAWYSSWLYMQAAPIEKVETIGGWLPIETAPKDGESFLVMYPRMMNLVVMARYNTVHKHFLSGHHDEGISRYTVFHEGDLWSPIAKPNEQWVSENASKSTDKQGN